jgi:hypothetical protein
MHLSIVKRELRPPSVFGRRFLGLADGARVVIQASVWQVIVSFRAYSSDRNIAQWVSIFSTEICLAMSLHIEMIAGVPPTKIPAFTFAFDVFQMRIIGTAR